MYLPTKLNLQKSDIDRLKRGLGVKITKGQVGRGIGMNITKTQHNRISKVHGGAQGHMMLKLTPSHLKHLSKTGGSIWSILAPYLLQGAKYVGRKALPYAVDYAQNTLIPKGVSYIRRKTGLGLKRKVRKPKGGSFRLGAGAKPRRIVKGGNMFTDFFTKTIPSFVSKPSNVLGAASFLPVVGPAMGAASLGAKIFGHGAKRKRKAPRRGGSFAL